MQECRHQWEMVNAQLGFVVFERCSHCHALKTYFSQEDYPSIGDKYREGNCFWSRVENAQSLRFDLKCRRCGLVTKFDDLMGLMHCTGCIEDCQVEILQRQYEPRRTAVLVAFGFLLGKEAKPVPPEKIEILNDYFNQRRDTSRSTIKLLSFELIRDMAQCRGIFIHDVGMLSLEPPGERKQLF